MIGKDRCGHCREPLLKLKGIDGEALVTIIEATSYHAGNCEIEVLKSYTKAKITAQPLPSDL